MHEGWMKVGPKDPHSYRVVRSGHWCIIQDCRLVSTPACVVGRRLVDTSSDVPSLILVYGEELAACPDAAGRRGY